MNKYKKLFKVLKYSGIACGIVAISYAITIGCTIALNYCGAQYAYAIEKLERKFTRVEVRTELLDPETIPTETLIEQISAEMGIPSIVTKAMALQESGGWTDTNRVRYESQLLDSKIFPPKDLNPIERQLWASSHGILQVIYGFHAKLCKLHSWADLHIPTVGIRCGLTVLKKNLESVQNIKDPSERLRQALRMYNGSGEKAEQYSKTVMGHLADIMLREKLLGNS